MLDELGDILESFNPLMPNGAFNICCPRNCVSRHNGGTSGAPLKPLRVNSALYIRWNISYVGDHLLAAVHIPNP